MHKLKDSFKNKIVPCLLSVLCVFFSVSAAVLRVYTETMLHILRHMLHMEISHHHEYHCTCEQLHNALRALVMSLQLALKDGGRKGLRKALWDVAVIYYYYYFKPGLAPGCKSWTMWMSPALVFQSPPCSNWFHLLLVNLLLHSVWQSVFPTVPASLCIWTWLFHFNNILVLILS